jgi:hypothetical protein
MLRSIEMKEDCEWLFEKDGLKAVVVYSEVLQQYLLRSNE